MNTARPSRLETIPRARWMKPANTSVCRISARKSRTASEAQQECLRFRYLHHCCRAFRGLARRPGGAVRSRIWRLRFLLLSLTNAFILCGDHLFELWFLLGGKNVAHL